MHQFAPIKPEVKVRAKTTRTPPERPAKEPGPESPESELTWRNRERQATAEDGNNRLFTIQDSCGYRGIVTHEKAEPHRAHRLPLSPISEKPVEEDGIWKNSLNTQLIRR